MTSAGGIKSCVYTSRIHMSLSRRYIEILHLANALLVLPSSNAIGNSVRLSSTHTFIGGESATCPAAAAAVGSTIFPFRGVHNLLSALFFRSFYPDMPVLDLFLKGTC